MDGERERHLGWDGCFNVRDLGGIPISGGGTTRRKAVIRSDNPERLTAEGWRALVAYGVRTVVDLRDHGERQADTHPRPATLTTVHVPLDDADDTAFWTRVQEDELDGSPLYYRPFLEHKAERCADAVAAVARARSGGVLIHCGLGRDRTGLIAMLLLALAGVGPGDIAADYELSTARLPPLFTSMGLDDQGETIRNILARRNTTARAALLATLAGLDVETRLREAGLSAQEVRAVRARLIDQSSPTHL